jgi:hypothetical protein
VSPSPKDCGIIVNLDKQLPTFHVGEVFGPCPNFRFSIVICREFCYVETVVSTHYNMLRQ